MFNKILGTVILSAALIVTSVFMPGGAGMETAYAGDTDAPEIEIEKDDISFCKKASELSEAENEGQPAADKQEKPARLLIVCKDDIDLSGYNGLIKAVFNGNDMCVAQFDSLENARKAYDSLRSDENIESVEFDEVIQSETVREGNVMTAQSISHLSWGAARIGADKYADYLTSKGHGTIKVAVVDSGVQRKHPFFGGRVLSGYNFVDGNTDVTDEDGHGTHVAGIIADCTQALSGLYILPVRVLDENGEGYTSDIAHGIIYAEEKGAKVINVSIGGGHSNYMDRAVYNCRKACIVCAAGNESHSIDWYYDCPAHISEAITVAAIDRDGHVADYSNFGKAIDIAAPGSDINSTVPINAYEVYSGTSMAAPHVSACAAMLKLNYGNIGRKKVEKTLARAANRKSSTKYYGSGVLNMKKLFRKIKAPLVRIAYKKSAFSNRRKTPKATVKINGINLIKGKDYSVKYVNNKKVGKAKVIITGRGTYSGKVTRSFRIVPRRTTAKLYVKKGGKLKIRIARKVSACGGRYFEIKYKQKGTSRWHTKITSKKTLVLKRLKKGKKYRVKLRAYKKVNGKRYFGKWSPVKTSRPIRY